MEIKHSFILWGKTGAGKSNLGNFLSNSSHFKVSGDKISQTKEVEIIEFSFDHTDYIIKDTPGFGDTDPEKIKQNEEKIINTIRESKIPISKILLVISFQESRIDESLQNCVQKIAHIFPLPNFWEHIDIIFTKYFSDDPDDLEEERRNWEKCCDLFKTRIKDERINNNVKIKMFFINNSKKNIEKEEKKIEILNSIKNTPIFYDKQFTINIPKERINMEMDEEPDEKYGEIEIRKYRSYSQIIYIHPNGKVPIKGPILNEKKWNEKIEFYEKLDKTQKIKMKKLYIDNIYKGDYLVSKEYLDINDIDHWEISCKLCEFKDVTYFNDAKKYLKIISGFLTAEGLVVPSSIAIGSIGLFGLFLIAPNIAPAIALTTFYGGAFATGIFTSKTFIKFGEGLGEKLAETFNIGVTSFENGCPKCKGKQINIVPILKKNK